MIVRTCPEHGEHYGGDRVTCLVCGRPLEESERED